MDKVTVVCDRCGKTVEGLQDESGTAGFYRLTPYWRQFANEDEKILCDACMWDDPRYKAVYQATETTNNEGDG